MHHLFAIIARRWYLRCDETLKQGLVLELCYLTGWRCSLKWKEEEPRGIEDTHRQLMGLGLKHSSWVWVVTVSFVASKLFIRVATKVDLQNVQNGLSGCGKWICSVNEYIYSAAAPVPITRKQTARCVHVETGCVLCLWSAKWPVLCSLKSVYIFDHFNSQTEMNSGLEKSRTERNSYGEETSQTSWRRLRRSPNDATSAFLYEQKPLRVTEG